MSHTPFPHISELNNFFGAGEAIRQRARARPQCGGAAHLYIYIKKEIPTRFPTLIHASCGRHSFVFATSYIYIFIYIYSCGLHSFDSFFISQRLVCLPMSHHLQINKGLSFVLSPLTCPRWSFLGLFGLFVCSSPARLSPVSSSHVSQPRFGLECRPSVWSRISPSIWSRMSPLVRNLDVISSNRMFCSYRSSR